MTSYLLLCFGPVQSLVPIQSSRKAQGGQAGEEKEGQSADVVTPSLPPSPAPKTQTEINRGSRRVCPGGFPGARGTAPTARPGPTLSLAFPDRFQGDSRLEQSGCYHHCVDENIERRNHYLDLAGIENYTSQFGPGKGAPSPVRAARAGRGWAGRGAGGRVGVRWPPWAGGRPSFYWTEYRVFLEEMAFKTFKTLK